MSNKTRPSTSEQQMESRKRNLLARMRAHIRRDYGFRCGDYESECVCCRLWQSYDDFALSFDV